ncbi:MAG: family hydrolase [Sphingomonadales bacterium]|nr:family hydrolase [Sphingomonadales bacterium]
MNEFPYAIVGFDLDGTFLDTSMDLMAAVNHALASAGRPPLTVEQVKPMIGGGAKHMLSQGMAATGGCEPAELDRLHALLLSYYEVNISAHTQPYPGAMAAIDAFDTMGVKVAIVTNKLEGLAVRLLSELDLLGRFVTVIGGDTMGPGRAKPAADPIIEMIARCGGGRTAFVGDSMFDIQAAKNAGVANVACSFGFLMQPVQELEADAVIDHYDELIPTLRRIAS